MRLLVPLLALTLVGCTDGKAPPAFDASVQLDGAVDLASGDGPAGDLAGCRTACDCPAGERCQAGACQTVVPNVFCCGTSACTGDNLCETSSGQVSQCSLPPDAGVTPDAGTRTDGGSNSRDGGAAGGCATRACKLGLAGDLYCTVACGSMSANCVAGASSGSGAHCMP